MAINSFLFTPSAAANVRTPSQNIFTPSAAATQQPVNGAAANIFSPSANVSRSLRDAINPFYTLREQDVDFDKWLLSRVLGTGLRGVEKDFSQETPEERLSRYGQQVSLLAEQNRGYGGTNYLGQGPRNPEMVARNLRLMELLRGRIRTLEDSVKNSRLGTTIIGNDLGNNTNISRTPQAPTTPEIQRLPQAPPTGQVNRIPQAAPPSQVNLPSPTTGQAPTLPQLPRTPQAPGLFPEIGLNFQDVGGVIPDGPPDIPSIDIPDFVSGPGTEGLWLSRKASNPLTRLHAEWSRGNPALRRLNEALDGDFASMLFRG
ncbi:hypothetical protein KC963_00135 [Candidatus Saccharibacteria bacterium]|nr:hypothetical protein [Candidatus Saccharibacteria bacterium]